MLHNNFDGFYKGMKVLITGHTGFKGSWLSLFLNQLGADVYGYALSPPTDPNLYNEANLDEIVVSKISDIRNLSVLKSFIIEIKPDIVIHLAAQPIVRDSYKSPVETYEVNVMGTVNLLEACRNISSIKAIVNVTSDKCYENQEWYWGYRETEPMGGYDPYSNSKGCSELVTSAYRNSFFNPKKYDEHGVAIATARAGNVVGGGDWALDRLIPDFMRAIINKEKLILRSPLAIRPWQHVMESLTAYLTLAKMLYREGNLYAEAWNFGPLDHDTKEVEWIAKKICELWENGAEYAIDEYPQPHEANYLKLDCSKAKTKLDWKPKWDIEQTIKSTVEWYKLWMAGENVREITINQIKQYLNY